MYTTYDGAKKRARVLQALLEEQEVEISLSTCQHAMARGGGYRDWEHLRRTYAAQATRHACLEGFLERAYLALPTQAVSPGRRWIEVELDLIRDRAAGREENEEGRAFRDHYARDFDLVSAIGVIHRKVSLLVKLGSGKGQHLREDMVCGLCLRSILPKPAAGRH